MVGGLSIGLKWLQENVEKTQDVEQKEKMIPFIKSEIAYRHHVCGLVLGIDMFDLDFWFQFDSVKQTIKCNSAGSGHVSHRRISAFNNHLDYRFIIFKNVKGSAKVSNVIHIEMRANTTGRCWVPNTWCLVPGAR